MSAAHSISRSSDAFPRHFGPRYILLGELGAGGMGAVYLALSGERVCALKTLRPDDAGPQMTERFREEARLYTRLSHPNLVYAHEAANVEGRDFVAMEHLRGKSLYEVLRRLSELKRHMPMGLAFFTCKELLRGLSYLHQAEGLHLIHRDVSPTNVMISYDGSVKLIDLGLATWEDKTLQTIVGENWGQTSYKSPEHFLGEPLDHRSDIFSAGVILWELLVGRRLFKDPKQRASAEPLISPSKFIEGMPWQLDAIVMTALATNPEDRYRDAEAFAADMIPFIEPADDSRALARLMGELFKTEQDRETGALAEAITVAKNLPAYVPPAPVLKAVVEPPSKPVGRPWRLALVVVGLVVGAFAGAFLMGAFDPVPGIAIHATKPHDANQAPTPLDTKQPFAKEPLPSEPPPKAPVLVSNARPPKEQERKAESSPIPPSSPRKDVSLLIAEGRQALGEGRIDDAIATGLKAVELNGGAPAHAFVGAAYMAANATESAERHLSKAVLLDPSDSVSAKRLHSLRQKLLNR